MVLCPSVLGATARLLLPASIQKHLVTNDFDPGVRSCYGRKFAPAGFRGAGASGWVDQESSNVLRHSYQAF